MTTVIPLKKGVTDPITGEELNSFEQFDHVEGTPPGGGEYLMVTMSDGQAARLAALIVQSIGTEPIAEVLEDEELIEALSRLPEDG